MLQRRGIIVLSFIFVLSLILAACGGNESGGSNTAPENGGEQASEETYDWKFITEEVDGQVQYEYAEKFAELLKEKSEGRITVTPYEYGGLGDEVDQVEQLQAGAVQFAIMSPGFTGTMVKEGQIFALQFLFPDSVAKTQEILNSSEALNKDLAAKYAEHEITVLDYWTEGATQWTANKAITSPSDFEGFKMRTETSPLIQESYKAYGAAPEAMSWGELYTGLDQGTVEGQENPIFFIYDASFHEVQSHMMLSNHNNYVAMTTVNTSFYNGLPEDIQAMIDEAVEEMNGWIFEEQDRQNKEFLEKMKNDTEHPTEIIELTEEQRAAFKELAIPVRDYYRENVSTVDGAILDKLINEIEAAQ